MEVLELLFWEHERKGASPSCLSSHTVASANLDGRACSLLVVLLWILATSPSPRLVKDARLVRRCACQKKLQHTTSQLTSWVFFSLLSQNSFHNFSFPFFFLFFSSSSFSLSLLFPLLSFQGLPSWPFLCFFSNFLFFLSNCLSRTFFLSKFVSARTLA